MKFRQFFLILSSCNSLLYAADPTVDKDSFWLFRPTPRELMREMSTDRPDQTESAYTVDAGHFQIESDVLGYTFDDTDGERFRALAPATLNLKVGLLNNVDLQVGVSPFVQETVTIPGERDRRSGFGDLVGRVKVNLWGNDEGKFAVAMMPFVKAPTASAGLGNKAVEGGLILPVSVALPHDWNMGLMTEFDFLQDSVGDGYHTDFVNSITFSHGIVGKLSGYVEFFTIVSTESGAPWQGMFDLGFTYAVTDDLQLDTGVNIGVTESAPDLNPFIGVSFRY